MNVLEFELLFGSVNNVPGLRVLEIPVGRVIRFGHPDYLWFVPSGPAPLMV